MKQKSAFLLLLTVSLLLTNCQFKDSKETPLTKVDTLMIEASSMFGTKSSLEAVIKILIQSDIVYQPELTLDTAFKLTHVETNKIAAVYCGIYSSDALYHSAFGNGDAAFESYTAAQILANNIGIGPYYIEHLIKRLDSGLSEMDSLLYKFDIVLAEVDTNLSQEERFTIIASYTMGNIIEKLYLINQGLYGLEGKKIADISDEGIFLYDLLLSEGVSIDLFVEIMDKYAKNKTSEFYIELVTLQSLYKELKMKDEPVYEASDIYEPTIEVKNISQEIDKLRGILSSIE